LKCSNCGGEIGDEDTFCKYCGTKLAQSPEMQTGGGTSAEDDVKKALANRFDGIKNKDESGVRALVDEHYSKFDDWPPYTRQKIAEALQNEFGAFKVLSSYSYEIRDFETNVLGDVALATFYVHYRGVIRNRPFDVTSRVTSILVKRDSGWQVLHEHFSRFPNETRQQQFMPPRRTMQP
jgi:ketosteroid isomerase-like protein